MDMKYAGIIPARYASTRFPGKPLAMIHGKTMIERVYTQASKVLKDVWVATDDSRIEAVVEGFGGRALMTADSHRSGTDRLAEAVGIIEETEKKKYDVIVNIQGDEPYVEPGQLRELMLLFDEKDTAIGTLMTGISDLGDLFDSNQPKVVVGGHMQALYFSRSPIPYMQGVDEMQWVDKHPYYKHIGLYAYRTEVLKAISKLPPSPLEQAESLEQLRWLAAGHTIRVAMSKYDNMMVDTPEDLERIAQIMGDKD